MSEKYPALDDDQVEIDATPVDETDFLKREAEVLGDEFKTEQDADLLNDAAEAAAAAPAAAAQPEVSDDDEFSSMQTSAAAEAAAPAPAGSGLSNPDAEKVIQEWKERSTAAIAERDSQLETAKAELQEEAVKNIDAFYETYNTKKEQQIESTRKDAEAFLKERDEFFAQDNTTWDRVLQLVNLDDAAVVGGRDRSKFKEILQRLKGKADAPGA